MQEVVQVDLQIPLRVGRERQVDARQLARPLLGVHQRYAALLASRLASQSARA